MTTEDVSQTVGSNASSAGRAGLWQKLFQSAPEFDDTGETVEWEENAHRALIEQDPIKTRVIFYSLCGLILILLVWSAFAEVDQVSRGEGKVIPSQQVQVLQSLDGGNITEILAREGQIVEQNQLLVKLDATRFMSNLAESRAELQALRAKTARLKAVAEGLPFAPSESLLEQAPAVVEQERILFQSSQKELAVLKRIASEQVSQREKELAEAKAQFEQAATAFELSSKELAVTKPLVASGAVSQVELLRLQRDISNYQGERDAAKAKMERATAAIEESRQKELEVELKFKNGVREDLSIAMSRLNMLEGSELGLSDRVKQTEVRSPVRGTIKRLLYNTIGGVVLPGKEIIEIIPLDDTLLLEAKIKPQDIAFLHPGQQANVKFTAYDFVVYGGLPATVEHIGADTITDENGNPFYIVRVRTQKSNLGEGRPIIPGMVASVDILTGKKTVLNYLLKPVLRAKQYALSEQ